MKMKNRCLTDEEMTSYVDGVVGGGLRKKIEAHLAACPVCLHNVAELKELVSPGAELSKPVPESTLARAESLIAIHVHPDSHAHDFDIVAVLKNGMCRILETTGDLLTPRIPAAAAVRGSRSKALNPRIARSLSGFLVTVELKAKGDEVKPSLTIIEEATSDGPDGVKVQLCALGTCETKYSHDGKADFSPVGQGLYRIDIEGIGSIDLEIR
jgi:anti-sigma factor RsiW